MTRPLLRQLGLALAVFLVLVVPYGRWCAEPYGRAVLATGGWLASAAGPAREWMWDRDRWLVVDQRAAIERFSTAPDRQPAAHGVLSVWAWIAVTPRRSIRWRLARAAMAVAVIAPIQVLVAATEAVAAYRNSVAEMVPDTSNAYRYVTVAVGGLAVTLTTLASTVLPVLIAFLVHPGFAHRRGGRPGSPSRGGAT